MTYQLDDWPKHTTGHLFLATPVNLSASFRSHWLIQTGVTIWKRPIRSNQWFLSHVTLKFDRWPWKTTGHFFNTKLYASVHSHMWSQTGVTVRKRPNWGKFVSTSVTLTFDLCAWPFAWTSLMSMVINTDNFMMIRWREHSEKGVTDRRTDRRTDGPRDWTINRAAWSQPKIWSTVALIKCRLPVC